MFLPQRRKGAKAQRKTQRRKGDEEPSIPLASSFAPLREKFLLSPFFDKCRVIESGG